MHVPQHTPWRQNEISHETRFQNVKGFVNYLIEIFQVKL